MLIARAERQAASVIGHVKVVDLSALFILCRIQHLGAQCDAETFQSLLVDIHHGLALSVTLLQHGDNLKGLTLCVAPQPVLDGPPGLIEKIISDAYVFAVARTAIRLGQGVAL